MRDNAESLARFVGEFTHLTQCHRLVGLVLEAQDDASRVVAASGADEGDRPASAGIGDGCLQGGYIDGAKADRNGADPRRVSAATNRRNEGDLVAVMGAKIRRDIFLIHGVADTVGMAAEGWKFDQKLLPNFTNGNAFGKLTSDFRGLSALTQSGEEFDREPIHPRRAFQTLSRPPIWPSSGISKRSIASRHAAGDPGSATSKRRLAIPASARLIIAAEPIS